MNRVCTDCAKPIGARNRSGLCPACILDRRRAAGAARRAAKICADCSVVLNPETAGIYCRHCFPKHKWNDASRAKASASRAKRWARELADPALRQKAVESGRRLKLASTCQEVIAKQVAGRRAAHWRPDGYEEMDRVLKAKGYLAADRRRMVLEQAAKDERRRVAALTPLQRDLERVRNGATVSTKVAMPSRQHRFSLIGSGLA